ncbi:MAG: M55 family metallopeptidase [Longimicrobiales bacterium]|nr:M55 family metallopeptidase [Longimicrobiales bacterium]
MRCCARNLVAMLLLTACSAPEEEQSSETAASPQPPAGAESGRTLSDPAPDGDAVLRVLLYHDMEGLSGQDDPRTIFYRERDLYARGRELLTADVNAVVEGLFAGGADEVHVVDAHGSGSPEPDLLLDKMDSRARLVLRDAPFAPYVDLVESGVYDAVAVVAMHAKTGAGGFASHTYTIGMEILLNGSSVTETEIIGYSWGRADVPVIFATGDDKLESNLSTMPWLVFVRVKNATSASTAELRSVDEVHADMRAGAERALRGRASARVMKLTTPVRAALRAVHPARLDMLEGVPGIDYHDQTVSFQADDFRSAYDGVMALVTVARGGYGDVLSEFVRGRDPDAMAGYSAYLASRWWDAESGRWTPPKPPEPAAGGRYHGSR